MTKHLTNKESTEQSKNILKGVLLKVENLDGNYLNEKQKSELIKTIRIEVEGVLFRLNLLTFENK
jgi:hypothetical protein